jgi:hypothetical protein
MPILFESKNSPQRTINGVKTVLAAAESEPMTEVMDQQSAEGTLAARSRQMEKFVVAFAKITTDKDGISLQGVYFGGMGGSIEEAEDIARECVNRIRGGTILPRVLKIHDKGKVLDALYDATDKFEQTTANMIEADRIINRTNSNRRK